MVKFELTAFVTLATLSSAIATPLKWTCDWPEARSQTFSLYQGETATFEPTFRVNGQLVTNAEIVAVWYTTNFVGAAGTGNGERGTGWWRLDNATFAPSNDVGAAAYRFFVEARIHEPFNLSTSQPFNSKLYRANGALRMLPSPGFTPNVLELPRASLDFAAVSCSNAPWPAEIAAATNALAQSSASAFMPASFTEEDPTVHSWAKAERKPGYTWDEITGKPHVPSVSMGDQSDGAVQIEIEGNSVTIPAWAQSSTQPLPTGYDDVAARAMRALVEETDPTISSWAKAPSKPTYSWNEISNKPTIPTVPTAQIDANTATNEMQDTAIASLSGDNESTRAIVMTWEQFLGGSNVVFSITNYISGAYSLDAAKFRVLELHNGAYNETYNSRDEIILHINHFKTNDFAIATNQVIGAVNEAISTKADKAWGRHTSSGGVAPSNTVYMTAPNTVFAGGLEYERVAVGQGAVCVLTTRGAPTWTQGDEGTFKFQDDGGTNFFGFAKTDSYTIGANTDGIDVANNIVTLTYDITMSGVPCVWYKSELSPNTPWEQLNLPDGSAISGASVVVTWDEDPPAGQEICYINCGNSPRGFFKATIEVAGDSKFMTNMRADLSGGIVCTNTAAHVNGIVKPTFNGSTVNWTWSAQ